MSYAFLSRCSVAISRSARRAWLAAGAVSMFLSLPDNAIAGPMLHVDRLAPLASPSGPGTPARPFDSIQAALAASRDSGTIVLVHPGVYRERVAVPFSGRPQHPLVIRASGAGVVLDGADELGASAGWLPYVGDVWMTPSVTWAPLQVFVGDTRLVRSEVAPSELPPDAFCYVSGSGLFVNLGGEDPASRALAVGRRSHGFLVSGRSDVVIDGFEVVRAEEKGIEVLSSERIIVRHNTMSRAYGGGIGVENSRAVQVFANTVSRNNHHGILFRLGVTNSIIDDNESFANAHEGEAWATGIYLAGSPGNLIECNRVHGNQDSGIEIQTGSNDTVVRQNRSWANGDHGFAQLYVTGTTLIGNVAHDNRHEEFSVEGNSTGTRLYNCIASDAGLTPGSFCLFVDSTSSAGLEADYNLFHNAAGGAPVKYERTVFASVAAFRAATGIGPHSGQADPRFVAPAQGDFRLAPDSPAIDAGTSAVPGWDASDAEGHARFDSPGVPNSGEGVVSYADRGAIEYRSDVLAVGGRTTGGTLALAGAYPNPTRRGITFALQLGARAAVRWSVFDVAGREVWAGDDVLEPGRQELRWPLTDASGRRVPEGLYLVRASHGGESATLRFVVMR